MATSQKDRIETIIALVSDNDAITPTNLNKIRPEFKQVIKVDSIKPTQRRNILKILHSTRALDSTLRSILDYYGIRNGTYSIGQFIIQFETHTIASLDNLSQSERENYQENIAKVRNNYLHTADTYPRNDSEVYRLISEMQSLLARVATL